MAAERLRHDQTGIENKTLKPYQVREVLCDMKIHLSFLLGMVCNIPNGGISDFGMALVSPRWIIGWDAGEGGLEAHPNPLFSIYRNTYNKMPRALNS